MVSATAQASGQGWGIFNSQMRMLQWLQPALRSPARISSAGGGTVITSQPIFDMTVFVMRLAGHLCRDGLRRDWQPGVQLSSWPCRSYHGQNTHDATLLGDLQ